MINVCMHVLTYIALLANVCTWVDMYICSVKFIIPDFHCSFTCAPRKMVRAG
jgi:hypothetical protein